MNRTTPSWVSSFWIMAVSAGCVTCKACAACEKLRLLATSMKAVNCLKVTFMAS
ncbi:Uncharacterised protein [Bordetella pertussis]|nr:Uncharacterised protein [Bordetella pertussis]